MSSLFEILPRQMALDLKKLAKLSWLTCLSCDFLSSALVLVWELLSLS